MSVIIVSIGIILHIVGLLAIYKGAGSILNKFGIGFLLGTILGVVPLVAMILSEDFAKIMAETIVSIPMYLMLFIILLIIFVVLLLLWLKMVGKINKIRRSSDRLQKSVEDSNEKITNVSLEIMNANKSIEDVNKKIKNRREEITEISKNKW
jgi:ABC-type multidrug transport system fused ATPase/permease subunit